MITIKNPEEIKALRLGGKILGEILNTLVKMVKPGLSTGELEDEAVRLITEAGGRPSFKNYQMGTDVAFPTALCVSINEEVVHGPAYPSRILKSGDIVDIDVGMEWPVVNTLRVLHKLPINKYSKLGGFYTDTSYTVAVGRISPEVERLLSITEEALYLGIKQARAGNRINDIARAIEQQAKKYHYGVVRDLVGHGVGHRVHEGPAVYNFVVDDKDEDNIVLKPGMVIAIEPMINLGTWKIETAPDNMTVVTQDGLPSAHFEHTVVITKDEPLIITEA
ncbi:MAG: type I methionyl aminopeptidase [Planctomycetes bacterium]|jgi:methionyl aminopeptidase|nr:type I methionyl aminopeptidase [Planctomycetota bacterium]